MWTIKINCRQDLGHLSTNVTTLLFIQIHSETNIFLSTKVIRVREKGGFISYSLAWSSYWCVCLKILPSRKHELYFMKNGNKSWDVLGDSRKHYRGPWAEIGKYWPGKEPIRLQDSLMCPLKKKIGLHNPLTLKISSVILLTVCQTIYLLLGWRIWNWINQLSPNWYFSLFSSLVCLILYWLCKEKFCLGH